MQASPSPAPLDLLRALVQQVQEQERDLVSLATVVDNLLKATTALQRRVETLEFRLKQ